MARLRVFQSATVRTVRAHEALIFQAIARGPVGEFGEVLIGSLHVCIHRFGHVPIYILKRIGWTRFVAGRSCFTGSADTLRKTVDLEVGDV